MSRDRRQLVPAVFRRKQICNASRTKNDVRVNPYHRIILPVPTGPESDRTRSVLQHAVYRAALFLWRGFQPCETYPRTKMHRRREIDGTRVLHNAIQWVSYCRVAYVVLLQSGAFHTFLQASDALFSNRKAVTY